jgi:cyclohexanecarboxylate-CoA ligase
VITFWELVEQSASERGEDVLLADDLGHTLTARELRDAGLLAAAGLYERGVRPGDVVSWQLPTALEAPVLMAACARLGVVQNPIIPVFRHREVGFMLDQLAARLIVVPETWRGFGYGEMARELGADVLALDFGVGDTPIRLPSGETASLPPAPPSAAADECSWVYYSSGTTADPKGARHSDRSVMAASTGMVDGLGMCAGDVYPIAWPFAHIGGVAMLTAALRTGGRLVLFESFDPPTAGERMAAHRPTILGSATPFFLAYIDAQRRHGREPLFPDLRVCVAGGAAVPEPVNREVAEVLGVRGVVGAWGLTEFPVATSETPDAPDVGSTVGRPVDGVAVRVVDGELQLKGPQCCLGYVDSALDDGAFDGEWFRTGDLGSIGADGRVRIEGRSKDLIIRNAENISALEVEEVLLRHPDVVDVAVIGVPDPQTGERVMAVVVLAPGAEIALCDLVAHCEALGLARHKRPEQLRIVGELPRNPMGKVVKRALQDEVADGNI